MKFKGSLDERRNSVRVDFRVPVEIVCSETDSALKGILVNLSIRGMLLELYKDSKYVGLEEGSECRARLIFQGSSSRLIIDDLQFCVARKEDKRLALEFSEPLEWFLLFTVYKDKQVGNKT